MEPDRREENTGKWRKRLLIAGGVVLGGIAAYKNRHKIKGAFDDFMGINLLSADGNHGLGGYVRRGNSEFSRQASRISERMPIWREIRCARIVNGLLLLDSDRIIQQPNSTGYDIHTRRVEQRPPRPLGALRRIVIHHAASPNENPSSIEVVNGWWREREYNEDTGKYDDWDRAGYHLLILGSGKVWQIMPITAASWGAGGYINEQAIHIAFAGAFSPTKIPTQKARDSFSVLCMALMGCVDLPNIRHPAERHIEGHRESVRYNPPTCPGSPESSICLGFKLWEPLKARLRVLEVPFFWELSLWEKFHSGLFSRVFCCWQARYAGTLELCRPKISA